MMLVERFTASITLMINLESVDMTGLRFVKRKVQPFDAGFPQYRFILQMLVAVAKDPSYGSTIEWQDVPVVDEDEPSNNKETEK